MTIEIEVLRVYDSCKIICKHLYLCAISLEMVQNAHQILKGVCNPRKFTNQYIKESLSFLKALEF